MPTPTGAPDYSKPTSALLLPGFILINNIVPRNVSQLIDLIEAAPTTLSPLAAWTLPAIVPNDGPSTPDITAKPCPHEAIIFLCSQKWRDARCGQSAPLLRKEMERHVRPLGLYRDMDDERPGGVGIYFISHVGWHKSSANVMIYRRHNAFGRGHDSHPGHPQDNSENEAHEPSDFGAAQCIWLARIRLEGCENLIRYTALQGKVVKPDYQLRGGFDRGKDVTSW
ncbi:Glycerol-3-phosphate/dihydroxyacetone phosphate acyltransferase [Fusarium falciforme]|nr:Glycerol-3-phosphate/dihydroxyacetone phosphate acyltransferase [Fusarium falciforme]